MEILSYADVLVATIHHLFRKGSPEVQGKLFAVSVRIDVNDYAADDELPPVGGFVHLAIEAESNYVSVYASFTERPTGWQDVWEWQFVCSHDSAWRDDGVRDTLKRAYRTILEQAEKTFGKPASKLNTYIAIDNMRIDDRTNIVGDKDLRKLTLQRFNLDPQMLART